VLDVLSFPEEELRELRAEFLQKQGLTDLTDHDAFFDLFYDEDLRFEFMSLFKTFTKCLNVVFPAKEALDFMGNYQSLMEINVLAGKHFRDERLSMKGIPPKLRKITDAFLESRGIEVRVEPISILDEDFQKEVKGRTRTKTKAAEIEHAIRHHLEVELDDDPDLQASFAEALKKILEEFRTRSPRSWKSYGSASSTPARSPPTDCIARSRCRYSACSRKRSMATLPWMRKPFLRWSLSPSNSLTKSSVSWN
jgi:type I restriction enzyme, R subunit